MALEDYRAEMESCCRCSACKFIPLEKITGPGALQRLPQHPALQLPLLLRRRSHGLRPRAASTERVEYTPEDGGGRLQLQPLRRLRCLLQVRHGVRRPRAPLRGARGVRQERADRAGVGQAGREHGQGGPDPAGIRRASGASGPRTWTSRTTPKDKAGVIYHAGCLAEPRRGQRQGGRRRRLAAQEGRSRCGHRQGQGALLRRPRLRDGLPGRGHRSRPS